MSSAKESNRNYSKDEYQYQTGPNHLSNNIDHAATYLREAQKEHDARFGENKFRSDGEELDFNGIPVTRKNSIQNAMFTSASKLPFDQQIESRQEPGFVRARSRGGSSESSNRIANNYNNENQNEMSGKKLSGQSTIRGGNKDTINNEQRQQQQEMRKLREQNDKLRDELNNINEKLNVAIDRGQKHQSSTSARFNNQTSDQVLKMELDNAYKLIDVIQKDNKKLQSQVYDGNQFEKFTKLENDLKMKDQELKILKKEVDLSRRPQRLQLPTDEEKRGAESKKREDQNEKQQLKSKLKELQDKLAKQEDRVNRQSQEYSHLEKEYKRVCEKSNIRPGFPSSSSDQIRSGNGLKGNQEKKYAQPNNLIRGESSKARLINGNESQSDSEFNNLEFNEPNFQEIIHKANVYKKSKQANDKKLINEIQSLKSQLTTISSDNSVLKQQLIVRDRQQNIIQTQYDKLAKEKIQQKETEISSNIFPYREGFSNNEQSEYESQRSGRGSTPKVTERGAIIRKSKLTPLVSIPANQSGIVINQKKSVKSPSEKSTINSSRKSGQTLPKIQISQRQPSFQNTKQTTDDGRAFQRQPNHQVENSKITPPKEGTNMIRKQQRIQTNQSTDSLISPHSIIPQNNEIPQGKNMMNESPGKRSISVPRQVNLTAQKLHSQKKFKAKDVDDSEDELGQYIPNNIMTPLTHRDVHVGIQDIQDNPFTDRVILRSNYNHRIICVRVSHDEKGINGIQCIYFAHITGQIVKGHSHGEIDNHNFAIEEYNISENNSSDYLKYVQGLINIKTNQIVNLTFVSAKGYSKNLGCQIKPQNEGDSYQHFNMDIQETELPICVYGSFANIQGSFEEQIKLVQIGFNVLRDEHMIDEILPAQDTNENGNINLGNGEQKQSLFPSEINQQEHSSIKKAPIKVSPKFVRDNHQNEDEGTNSKNNYTPETIHRGQITRNEINEGPNNIQNDSDNDTSDELRKIHEQMKSKSKVSSLKQSEQNISPLIKAKEEKMKEQNEKDQKTPLRSQTTFAAKSFIHQQNPSPHQNDSSDKPSLQDIFLDRYENIDRKIEDQLKKDGKINTNSNQKPQSPVPKASNTPIIDQEQKKELSRTDSFKIDIINQRQKEDEIKGNRNGSRSPPSRNELQEAERQSASQNDKLSYLQQIQKQQYPNDSFGPNNQTNKSGKNSPELQTKDLKNPQNKQSSSHGEQRNESIYTEKQIQINNPPTTTQLQPTSNSQSQNSSNRKDDDRKRLQSSSPIDQSNRQSFQKADFVKKTQRVGEQDQPKNESIQNVQIQQNPSPNEINGMGNQKDSYQSGSRIRRGESPSWIDLGRTSMKDGQSKLIQLSDSRALLSPRHSVQQLNQKNELVNSSTTRLNTANKNDLTSSNRLKNPFA